MALVQGNLKITPEVLRRSSEKLERLSEDMKANLAQMTKCIDAVRDAWKDEQGAQFVDIYNTDVAPKLAEYYGLVQKYSDFVSGANRGYTEYVQRVNQSLKPNAHYVR